MVGVQVAKRLCDLGEPITTTFARLRNKELLQPLMDTPMLNPLPKNFKKELFCEFHQIPGHDTNKYRRLRHEIQDLIDAKKIDSLEQGPNEDSEA